MKRIIPVFLLSLLVLSCATLESVFREPQVSFSTFKITEINFDSIDVLFTYKIDNPNPIGITLPRFAYNLFVEDASFVSGTSEKPISIAQQNSSLVDIPLTLSYEDLIKVVGTLLSRNEAGYKITTDFFLNIPVIGERKFSLDHSGKIPILKLPEISLGEVKVTSANILSPAVELSVNITNNNVFTISPDALSFQVLFNNSKMIESTQKNISALTPGATSTVKIPIQVNPVTFGTELISTIINGKSMNVNLTGNLGFNTDYEGIGKTNLPFDLKKALQAKK